MPAPPQSPFPMWCGENHETVGSYHNGSCGGRRQLARIGPDEFIRPNRDSLGTLCVVAQGQELKGVSNCLDDHACCAVS
jgi:hypothetical protein